MIVSFHPCIEADVHIIVGDRSLTNKEKEFLKKADAIILPQACSRQLYEICSNIGVPIFPEYKYRFEYPGKTGQIRLFKELCLPYPCTICLANKGELLKKMDYLAYKLPFFIKEDMKHEGKGIYFINSMQDIEKVWNRIPKDEPILVQQFIECGGDVLRIVVIGEYIISYWKRPKMPDQVITTLSENAEIDYKWKPHLQEKGKRLVKDLVSKTGINLSAIDMIFEEERPLLLEINYYFGRRGLGGSDRYYKLLFSAVKKWLLKLGLSASIRLVC